MKIIDSDSEPCSSYMADYSETRGGWWVFKGTKNSKAVTVEYWAGPFSDQAFAERAARAWRKMEVKLMPYRKNIGTVSNSESCSCSVPKRDILLLCLRNAIADKEWTIACANMEIQHRGGWSCDWSVGMREAQEEIDFVLPQLHQIAD